MPTSGIFMSPKCAHPAVHSIALLEGLFKLRISTCTIFDQYFGSTLFEII